jgi:hypothetical protein
MQIPQQMKRTSDKAAPAGVEKILAGWRRVIISKATSRVVVKRYRTNMGGHQG